jgi:hypothetical protein
MVRTSVWLCTFFSLMVVSLLAGVDPANAASTAIKSKNQEVVLQPGQSITLSVPCGTAPGCGTNGFALFDANVNLSIQVVQCGLVTGDSCSVDVTGFFGQQVAAGSGATGRRGHGHPCLGEHE